MGKNEYFSSQCINTRILYLRGLLILLRNIYLLQPKIMKRNQKFTSISEVLAVSIIRAITLEDSHL
jgi:hypothetical protein